MSTYFLHKLSSPTWTKKFEDKEDLINELRENICNDCLNNKEPYSGAVVDTEYQGKVYLCRDINTLLSTSCGCELEVEEK